MGGSVEISIHAIARRLAKDHKVTVIGRRHSRLPNVQRDGSLTFVRVPSRGYAAHVVRALKKGSYDWIQVDNRPRLAAHIKKAYPHKRVSLFLHSLTFVSPPQLYPKQAAELLAKPDLIVVNSTSLYEAIAKQHPHVKKNIRKVLLGVDTARFRPAMGGEKRRLKALYGAAGNAFTVLFVGRVIPRKGIPVLLRAMQVLRKSVPSARAVIAGGGKAAYVAKLKTQARRLGIPATFTGLLPHRSIHRIYRLADAFVCPSQKHEAFGLVNIEAMASGVPVVASRIGGIGEAVTHGRSGYLVEAYRDPKQFAKHLAQLAKQPDLSKRMAAQARTDAVRQFGWSGTARKLAELYGHGKGAKVQKAEDLWDGIPGDEAGEDFLSARVGRLQTRGSNGRGNVNTKLTIRYRRYVHSKLDKTKALLADAAVKGCVPQTLALTAENLREMLDTHKMVYVKPNIGTYGNGVIRVEWRENANLPFSYQHGLKVRRFASFDELYRSLGSLTNKRRYLVQRGIRLLTYKRVRFDIRVMVQLNPQGKWVSTGVIGRVADPRKIVTNVHNGGTLVPVETLMGSYLSGSRLKSFVQELHSLGVKSAKALQDRYPGLKEIGLDVAVDGQFRPWILEANTAPDPYIFQKLKDKSIYRKVFSYWKMHQPKLKAGQVKAGLKVKVKKGVGRLPKRLGAGSSAR